MRIRLQPWQLAVVVVLFCVTAVGVVRWRVTGNYDAKRLLSALPTDPATLLYIDTAALREGGILDAAAGSAASEEADYRLFIELTGFNYRTDLDAVAAAFVNGNMYATLRGRFSWSQLATFAQSQGGECHYTICRMPGSRPDRNISFYPITNDVLALAVTRESGGVNKIQPGQWKEAPSGGDPLWLSAPASAFQKLDTFPAVMRTLLSPLASARGVKLAAGAQGDHLQLRLEVSCLNELSARELTQQLSDATALLKRLSSGEKAPPNPSELSAVLTAGTFEQRSTQVIGRWPLERRFVEALAGGQVQ